MPNLQIALELIAEAATFNTFGAANTQGSVFQNALVNKFETWKLDKKTLFTRDELRLLKPIIAHSLVSDQMGRLVEYPLNSDKDLSFKDRIIKRTIHSLTVARILASCGSFNCEIANLVLCLALIRRVTIPIELINFSGVRDDGKDSMHTFITLGCTNQDSQLSLGKALCRLGIGQTAARTQFAEYIVCDAYHQEAYPITEALTNATQKLARYDDITHVEQAAIRRFLYIQNPAMLYDNVPEIQQLCKEVLAQRDNQILKTQVNEIFREILLQPFAVNQPEKAFRNAANQGKTDYVKFIHQELGVDINVQDDNPEKRQTALHWAVKQGHVECAQALLILGANPNIANAQGVTVAQLITNSSNANICALKELFTTATAAPLSSVTSPPPSILPAAPVGMISQLHRSDITMTTTTSTTLSPSHK